MVAQATGSQHHQLCPAASHPSFLPLAMMMMITYLQPSLILVSCCDQEWEETVCVHKNI